MARHLLNSTAVLAAFLASSIGHLAADDGKTPPATVAEVRDCIDWAKVPLPEGAVPYYGGFSARTIKVPGAFAAAVEFYRKNLPALGWKEDATPIPGIDQKAYLYLVFDRGDMRLSINGFRSMPDEPMTLSMTLGGNVDARSFAKPADAKVQTDQKGYALFTTGLKPEEAAEFCRKAILERGFKEVVAESAKFHAKEGRTILRFLKNAMEIGVVVRKDDMGRTEASLMTQIRYNFEPGDVREALTAKEVPEPANFEDYTAVLDLRQFPLMEKARKRDRQQRPIAMSNSVSCQVPGKMEDALAFHRQALADKGWKEIGFDNQLDNRYEISCEKQGYLVTLGIGREGKEGDVQVAVTNHGNIDLRQLPYPPGCEIGPDRSTFINCNTTLSVADAGEFYRKEMVKLGWKEQKVRGQGSIEFAKAVSVLRIEIQKDTEERTSIKLIVSIR